MTITLDEQLRRRPVDPAEMERLKAEMRQYARAFHLREVREAQAMTQVEVAQELGIGQNRVSQIEHGDTSYLISDSRFRQAQPTVAHPARPVA